LTPSLYYLLIELFVSFEERMTHQAERQDSARSDASFDCTYDDPDDFVASSKPSGGAKGNAKGSNKDKNSSGNIYSVKHNRIKEGQRETRKSAPKK
jgi:hypothetical protein